MAEDGTFTVRTHRDDPATPSRCGVIGSMASACAVLGILALLLSACEGNNVPPDKGSQSTGTAPSEEEHEAASQRAYNTKTGKTVVVTETHPVGASLSTIEVSTRDFEHNRPERYEDRDPISDVFVADLDGNGFDEIYLITTSAGSGSYGSVLAFASNRDKSLSMINFPGIVEGDSNFEGYMGHDRFTIEDGKLIRTFPIYNEGDRNSNPTGGRRRLTYGLHPGEAMWQLKIEKVETLDE